MAPSVESGKPGLESTRARPHGALSASGSPSVPRGCGSPPRTISRSDTGKQAQQCEQCGFPAPDVVSSLREKQGKNSNRKNSVLQECNCPHPWQRHWPALPPTALLPLHGRRVQVGPRLPLPSTLQGAASEMRSGQQVRTRGREEDPCASSKSATAPFFFPDARHRRCMQWQRLSNHPAPRGGGHVPGTGRQSEGIMGAEPRPCLGSCTRETAPRLSLHFYRVSCFSGLALLPAGPLSSPVGKDLPSLLSKAQKYSDPLIPVWTFSSLKRSSPAG